MQMSALPLFFSSLLLSGFLLCQFFQPFLLLAVSKDSLDLVKRVIRGDRLYVPVADKVFIRLHIPADIVVHLPVSDSLGGE